MARDIIQLEKEFNTFRNTINSMFDSFFKHSFLDDFSRFHFGSDLQLPVLSQKNQPVSHVNDLEKEYEFVFEIPGVKKEDIQLEIKDGYLVLHAEHNDTKNKKEGDGEYSYTSRYSYSKTIKLPENINPEGILAEYKNGVLHVLVPKLELEDKNTKVIDIK
jgi:HSP20 family protein